MTAFNRTPQTYDPNGNLTNDGTNTYTWDARNHLVGITGANSASFVYDADGRRDLKAINGTTTQFLYDGLNPVQELQNGAPSANMLTGLGIDEFFQRIDSGGTYDYLSDILGSTVALTSTSGAIQQQYLYQPFGSTGSGGSNPYQFTGRENDGTGLYYNRARYYSPSFQRFVTQDPLGFDGGDANMYAYVWNNPINLIDPWGLTGVPIAVPPNIPGGPFTPDPPGSGRPPGHFLGPKQPSGPRPQCQWVPPENEGGPPGSKGYWKTQQPGQKGWQRYDPNGDPITPEEAHPGPAVPVDPAEPIELLPWVIPIQTFCNRLPGLCGPPIT
jgi:RHS repeat-associated protein